MKMKESSMYLNLTEKDNHDMIYNDKNHSFKFDSTTKDYSSFTLDIYM